MADQAHIRNFSIIAHIDHGKSTLADRILELTHTVDPREMRAAAARLDGPRARARDHDQGPGRARVLRGARRRDLPAAPDRHARATSTSPTRSRARWPRARARCWWSTPPRASRPRRSPTPTWRSTPGLELIPCLNKIDLPGAEPERVRRGDRRADRRADPTRCGASRAKTGEGVAEVLEELVARVPPPHGDPDAPPRALIFDSEFDQYRGVIAYIRVVDGTLHQGRGDPRDGRPAPRPTSTTSASSRPHMTPADRLQRRRGRLPDHRHQGRHAACASATR